MPADRSWQISTPQTLDFHDPVDSLEVRVVGGTVNVVGTSGPGVRVEVGEVEGPPLVVSRSGRSLTIAYEDVPWKGFLKWLDRKGWHRSAVVSVSVPAGTRLSVGVVGANAFVSGIAGRTEVRGVNGGTTLVGLTGPVRADTVSGDVEAQGIAGRLDFNSVSGDLTVIDGRSTKVRADSVSGQMILDLDPGAGGAGDSGSPAATGLDVGVATVSGAVALRLPSPVDAAVEASSASGGVSSAFGELAVDGQWGAQKASGTLGFGSGRIKADSVSGSIALLRRPAPRDDETPHFSKDV